MRLPINRPGRIRFAIEDDSGNLIVADSLPSITVLAGDGTTIFGPTTATMEETGIYYVTLPAQTQYDLLTATCTATVASETFTLSQPVRLVARRIAPLSRLRLYPSMATLDAYTFMTIVDQTEDLMANALNFSPVLTGERSLVRVNDFVARLYFPKIYFPQALYSMTFNDVVQDSAFLSNQTMRGHALENKHAYYGQPYDPVMGVYGGGYTPGVWNAWVSYGLPECPNDIVMAVAKLANHVAKGEAGQAQYPDRAVRVMTEASEIFLSSPDGDKRVTGLPEVDAVIIRYRLNPAFAESGTTFA